MIYLQPQFKTPSSEILNVMNSAGEPLGYLSYHYKEDDDIYVLGQLEDVAEQQNYKEIVTQYIAGLKSACSVDQDPYVLIHCGGMALDFSEEEDA